MLIIIYILRCTILPMISDRLNFLLRCSFLTLLLIYSMKTIVLFQVFPLYDAVLCFYIFFASKVKMHYYLKSLIFYCYNNITHSCQYLFIFCSLFKEIVLLISPRPHISKSSSKYSNVVLLLKRFMQICF